MITYVLHQRHCHTFSHNHIEYKIWQSEVNTVKECETSIKPRKITSLIQFPNGEEYQFDDVQFHNKILEKTDKIRRKYKQMQPKPIQYQMGEQILLKNRGLPSTMEGIPKKLLLLYTGPVSYTHLDVYKRQDY